MFYHFARKIDLLTALFEERMPAAVPHEVDDVVVAGDVAGSLLALADRLAESHRRSRLVRTILWREADTHPEVARCLHAFHDQVVDFAIRVIERRRRRGAAATRPGTPPRWPGPARSAWR